MRCEQDGISVRGLEFSDVCSQAVTTGGVDPEMQCASGHHFCRSDLMKATAVNHHNVHMVCLDDLKSNTTMCRNVLCQG